MKIELRNHPAQKKHPVSGKPLFYDDGTHVPLFPDMRGVYLDGYLIGYCGVKPEAPLTFIRRVDGDLEQAIRQKVQEQLGGERKSFQPPSPQDVERAEGDLLRRRLQEEGLWDGDDEEDEDETDTALERDETS